jgi:hypothetical protein
VIDKRPSTAEQNSKRRSSAGSRFCFSKLLLWRNRQMVCR